MPDLFYQEFHIRVHMEEMGEELCVTISGGDRAHIGSVAIAEPRESLTGDGTASATVSTYNFPGHKDDIIANEVARSLTSATGHRCVCLCGIHYDRFSEELYTKLLTLQEQILNDLLDSFKP